MTCPFCEPVSGRVFYNNSSILCLWDGYPVSDGHALVIPKRHIATWFEASFDEQASLFKGIELARQEILRHYEPDGFNIGINVGEAAGQTVPHLHIHVIPRYLGDVFDPRGGVRHVIPGKANYLVQGEGVQDADVNQVSNVVRPSIFGNEAQPLIDSFSGEA